MDLFGTSTFPDLGLQPNAFGSTDSVSPQEQNVERMWKLHSTLLEQVYRVESQGADIFSNGSLPDAHPLATSLFDVANPQSDHPIHQMMRSSQAFLEIIQSFVSSYRKSVCSIPSPDRASTDCLPSSDQASLISHGNGLTNTPNESPPSSSIRHNEANGRTDERLLRQLPALLSACQTQFPICLTITTCHVLLIRLHHSVLTDLYASVQALVARYTPAGELTGPLAVLDNFSGSAPFSNVELDGSILKLDGIQQITTVLQLSYDLLERIDRGAEILLAGAGHILSAPGSYMSILEALTQQEARSGRRPAIQDRGSSDGRAARLAPSRLLVEKIRKVINDTCL